MSAVREHPAPSGALRLDVPEVLVVRVHPVREHPAPPGALRPFDGGLDGSDAGRQGAPSTIRCIKTP